MDGINCQSAGHARHRESLVTDSSRGGETRFQAGPTDNPPPSGCLIVWLAWVIMRELMQFDKTSMYSHSCSSVGNLETTVTLYDESFGKTVKKKKKGK
ncbi:Multistep phosphorelay regulator 1 [Fusarium oxysporum f. sp. albedinis]|nr:Multistep phosphorelay regulator 1 [Fusarium oxysporum f. sp. albedinis]